jgi:hypothetical protein
LLWFPAAALAQDDGGCSVPFTEFDLRALVARSEDALMRDDALGHERLFAEFRSRVPCLDGQLPKDAWSRLLRGEAIVRRVRGEPWIPLLDTALAIYSDLDVPPYLLEQFSRLPPVPPSTEPLAPDAALFVDGVLVGAVPTLTGEHVVQVWRDGRWRSAYVQDAPVPTAWIAPAAAVVVDEGPARWKPSSRGTFGALLGPSIGRQLVEDPAEWLGDQRQVGVWAGATTTGVVPVAGPGGAYWDVALAAQLLSVRKGTDDRWGLDPAGFLPSAWLGPAVVLEDVSVGVGGGGFALLHYEGEEPVTSFYPQPDVSLAVRRDRADFAVNAGLTPAAMHAGMAVGSLSDTERPLVLRVGVDVDLALAWFTEAPPGDRSASALSLVTAFRLDGAWGRDR